MTPTTVLRNVRTVDQLAPFWVAVSGEAIEALGTEHAPRATETVDADGLLVAPGFVDMHSHGGGGADYTEGADAARRAAAFHLAQGTTTTMASLVSARPKPLIEQVQALVSIVRDGTVAGIHLEGPWIARSYCGAHDPGALRAPTRQEIDAVLTAGDGCIAMVTLAPELPGGLGAIESLVAAGVVVAIGHTGASTDMTRSALDAGATVATHLFNAMPSLHHRDPGPVGALLRDPRVTVELIADSVHVHPDVLALALATVGPARTALITDALAAAGAADGHYPLGTLDVTVSGGIARVTETGALAGSTLTLARALRVAVADAGWSPADALTAATATPARALGLTDRGALVAGARADLVLLDDHLAVVAVMRQGAWVVRPTLG